MFCPCSDVMITPHTLFRTELGSSRNVTRTNLFRSSLTSSGSVPLNRRISRLIISHPRPRCSMNRQTTMEFAIISFRERAVPPDRAFSTVM